MHVAIVASTFALISALALTPFVREFALRRGWLDRGATSRNIHRRPVPRLGGVAIVTAFFVTVIGALECEHQLATVPPRLLGVLIGGAVIAALGIYDDLHGANARTKFAVQLAVAASAWCFGCRIDVVLLPFVGAIDLGAFGLPLTVLWISGVTNAVNLVDGLDSLAAGVSVVVLLALFSFALGSGDSSVMLLTAVLAGAVVGFLFFNFHPASIFMGDTGSMFIGFMLAVLSIEASRTGAAGVPLLVPIIALGYPIGDTMLAMVRRRLRGVPMFSADRAHIHHRLLGRGLTQRETALILCGVSACLCAIAAVLLRADDPQALIALASAAAVTLAGMRWLGFLDWNKLGEIAAARRRNIERLHRVSQIAVQLEHAMSPEALGASLAAVGAALQVDHVALKARGRSWASSPTRPANLHVVRFGLQHESAQDEVLEVGWRGGGIEADRDTEIAIEQLFPHVRAALRRVDGRARQGSFASGLPRMPLLRRNDASLPTIIVGAGVAGETLALDLISARFRKHQVVGFVDDDPAKAGRSVAGRPVLGTVDGLPRLIAKHRAASVLIAITRINGASLRRILTLCAGSNARFRLMRCRDPERVSASRLEDVCVDDLLARRPTALETADLRALIGGRTALVTGAAGQIGGELCRHLLAHGASELVLIDTNENRLELLANELRDAAEPNVGVFPEIAGVRDYERLRQLASHYRPQLVLHAAAYEDDARMEEAPEEAVKTNVFGALNVAVVAHEIGAEELVLVSSHKAVNPTSVAGVTRRVAEMIVRDLAQRSSTRTTAVRCGDVLGPGGVAALIEEDIASGGPVALPHPFWTRRFVAASEAAGLVLVAGLGGHGELCVLDGGEPIRVAELASHLITLAGRTEKEIAITYRGLDGRETLHDEVPADPSEQVVRVSDGISVAKGSPPPRDLSKLLHDLQEHAIAGDREGMLSTLHALVPTYHHIPGTPASCRPTPIASVHVRRAVMPSSPAAVPAKSPVPAGALAVVDEPDEPGGSRLRLPGAGWLHR